MSHNNKNQAWAERPVPSRLPQLAVKPAAPESKKGGVLIAKVGGGKAVPDAEELLGRLLRRVRKNSVGSPERREAKVGSADSSKASP